MIANAESAPQDVRDEESRVLDFIATCPEGASYFTVTTELGMARTRSVSILEKLHRDGKLSYDCKTKMYFSKPQVTEVITRPQQKDRLTEYERKIEAGEIPAPDPKADRAAPDRFPPEERPKNRCRFCGKVVERYLWQHENYCKENPDHKTPPGVASKRRKERTEKTSTPVDNMVPDIALDPPGSERQLTEGPAPIDESVPPLSEERKTPEEILEELREKNRKMGGMEDLPAEDWPYKEGSEVIEEHYAEAQNTLDSMKNINDTSPPSSPVQPITVVGTSSQCTEMTSSLSKDVLLSRSSPFVPCPPDPLAAFAQQHRVRVWREISKLRRVERKLRRRAAAAEAMAERVHAARRTKERELRRFEKELAEVGA